MKTFAVILVAFLAQGYAVSVANFPHLNFQVGNPIAHHEDVQILPDVLPGAQEAHDFNILPVDEHQINVLPVGQESHDFNILPVLEDHHINVLPGVHEEIVPEFSNLPGAHESHDFNILPVDEHQINILPGLHEDIVPEFSHLPGQVGPEFSNLPGHAGPEFNVLPVDISPEFSNLPSGESAQSTPPCVGYIKSLLLSVLAQLDAEAPVNGAVPEMVNLPGKIDSGLDFNNLPSHNENVKQESPLSACEACFQKVQLLVEKANSKNSLLTF